MGGRGGRRARGGTGQRLMSGILSTRLFELPTPISRLAGGPGASSLRRSSPVQSRMGSSGATSRRRPVTRKTRPRSRSIASAWARGRHLYCHSGTARGRDGALLSLLSAAPATCSPIGADEGQESLLVDARAQSGHSSGTVGGLEDTLMAQKCPSRVVRPARLERATLRFEA